jgi:Rha family phage regulatory protein
MKEIVFIENDRVVTDSLMIAETFGKRHDSVLRDIEKQIEKLLEAGEEEFSLHNFVESTYTNERGRQYKKYLLTEEAFALVTMSYVTVEAMKFKVRFIEEFKRMKQELEKRTHRLPTTYKEALLQLVEQVERNEQLEAKTLMLEQQVAESAPKVTYYDLILSSTGTVNITQIAKDYGLSGKRLNEILHEEGVQYKMNDQWLLYHKYQDKGYTKSHTHMDGNGKARLHTKWTQKGRLFIHQLLDKRGITALVDREHAEAN